MTEDQLLAFHTYQREAIIELAHHLIGHATELAELAITRASTIGITEYGDTSYHKENEYLEIDVDEELADAIFYMHIILLRRTQAAASTDV